MFFVIQQVTVLLNNCDMNRNNGREDNKSGNKRRNVLEEYNGRTTMEPSVHGVHIPTSLRSHGNESEIQERDTSSDVRPVGRSENVVHLDSVVNYPSGRHIAFVTDGQETINRSEKAFEEFLLQERQREEDRRKTRSLEDVLKETRNVLRNVKQFNRECSISDDDQTAQLFGMESNNRKEQDGIGTSIVSQKNTEYYIKNDSNRSGRNAMISEGRIEQRSGERENSTYCYKWHG